MLIQTFPNATPAIAPSTLNDKPGRAPEAVDVEATLEFFRVCTKRLHVPESKLHALGRAADNYVKSRVKSSGSPGIITILQDLVADCRPSTLIAILSDVLATVGRLPQARLDAPSDEAQRMLAQIDLSLQHVNVLIKDMQLHGKNPASLRASMSDLRQRATQQLRLLASFTERLKNRSGIALIDWPGVLCAREMTLRELSILSELMHRSGKPLDRYQKLRDTIGAADKKRLDPQEVEHNRKLLRELRDGASAEPHVQRLMQQVRNDALAQRTTDIERWKAVAQGKQYEMAKESFHSMQEELRSLTALRNAAGVNQEALGRYSDDDVKVMSAAFEMMHSMASRSQKGILKKQLHLTEIMHARVGMLSSKYQPLSDVPAMLHDSLQADLRRTAQDLAQKLESNMKQLAEAGLYLARICEDFRLIRANALPTPFVHPQDLLLEAEALLTDARKASLESDVSELMTQVEDLKSMAAHVDQDSRADGLLWRQVQHLDRQTDVLAFIRKGLYDLRARLDVALPTGRNSKKTNLKKATKQKAVREKTRKNCISVAAESDFRKNCEAICQQWDFKPHADFDGESESGIWQRNTSSRNRQLENKVLAKKTFFEGTFESAWHSAMYHFKKHAAYHHNATFKQYIERALSARDEWDDNTLHANLANPLQMVRVVSTHKTWLVFEDDPEGRIISYHDRSERPYR